MLYKVCNIKNKHFIGFLRLKYSSQLNYRRALDIIKRKAGYYQMIDVTQEGIRGFRNELIKEDCATSQIDQCLMVSSVLWTFAAEFCDLPLGANSTTGIMRVHGEHKAHKRWPMQVIEAFYAKANRVMRLALYLLAIHRPARNRRDRHEMDRCPAARRCRYDFCQAAENRHQSPDTHPSQTGRPAGENPAHKRLHPQYQPA